MGTTKDKIEQLFKSSDILYYSDVAEKLGLDLEVVVNICQELMREGKIAVADSKSVQRRLNYQMRDTNK